MSATELDSEKVWYYSCVVTETEYGPDKLFIVSRPVEALRVTSQPLNFASFFDQVPFSGFSVSDQGKRSFTVSVVGLNRAQVSFEYQLHKDTALTKFDEIWDKYSEF